LNNKLIYIVHLVGYFYSYFPTVLKVVVLGVSNQNFKVFSLFHVDFKRRICLTARCTSAANAIDSYADIFNGRPVSVNPYPANVENRVSS
jgi:hypothetical protein